MSKRAIYYDTETTGTRPDKDRVIEIAAFDPVDNRTFVQLINPEMFIPQEAIAIHHITDEMVKNAPSFKEVALQFSEFCGSNAALIAHNNDNFDRLFLKEEFQRSQMNLPDWTFVDTLKWARKYRSDLPRHNLQFLREIYGIAANEAHRALNDVLVLHEVFRLMIDDLPVEVVISLLSVSQDISRMPFGKYNGRSLKEVPKDYVQWLVRTGAFEKAENKQLKESFEKLNLL